MTTEIELGRKVKCRVTGFTGIATSRTVYLNGCARISVQPPVDKEGKHPDGMYIDETALDYVGDKRIDAGPKHQRGGPSTSVRASRAP